MTFDKVMLFCKRTCSDTVQYFTVGALPEVDEMRSLISPHLIRLYVPRRARGQDLCGQTDQVLRAQKIQKGLFGLFHRICVAFGRLGDPLGDSFGVLPSQTAGPFQSS